MTAKNSTSMQRDFAGSKDFVRGKGNNFPFAPGGIEEALEDAVNSLAEGMLEEKHPLLDFENDNNISDRPSQLDFNSLMQSEDIEIELLGQPIDETEFVQNETLETPTEEVPPPPEELPGDNEIDKLLPNENLVAKESVAQRLAKKEHGDASHKKREWAHEINVNEPFDDFHEVVPEMAHEFPFELDTFQKHAVYHLEMGDSVFVAAHTSAGKTAVAEYAISLAAKHMTKAIYTSPIKALSNQKFRDFKKTYGDDVGILTGDVQIKPEASCLIMTTEILRSMLYRGADLIRDVEFVIFDEVHYVNDLERGVVWEEVIIMLPAHVNLILLSATVPNTKEFADWVGRTKKKDIYVISTLKRPVPLEHHLYANKELFKIVAANEKKLNNVSYKNASDALSKRKDPKEVASQRSGGGGRGGMAVKAPARTPGRSFQNMQQTDRNLYVHMMGLLAKKNLLPVVVFTFSKKKCEEYASALSNLDLTSSTEKSEIHVFIEKSLARLRGSDRELPQVIRTRDLLSRGVAVHHGGLLPIIKEIVEILFARGLVKVLFATETFAMGVNMPARSVVFSGIRKHDGRSFRDLLPGLILGEYTQMSGRAGRRGLDDTGVVIIACGGEEPPDTTTLSTMILGKPTKLQSQFRLTYNMILNLLRVEALKVEEMIKRSFSENSSQKLLPDTKKLVDESEKSLSNLQQLDCMICSADIQKYYDLSNEVLFHNRNILARIASHPVGHRALVPGRAIIINNAVYRNAAAVILQPVSTTAVGSTVSVNNDRVFYCFILVNRKHMGDDGSAERSPLPVTDVDVPSESDCRSEIAIIPLSDVAFVTKTALKINVDSLMNSSDELETIRTTKELLAFASESKRSSIAEYDWSKIKDIEFQESLRAMASLLQKMRTDFQCTRCPDLEEHTDFCDYQYALVYAHRRLQAQIDNLKMTISDQNLELLPDYQQRVEVLKTMSYIDNNGTVQLKGRVACEINTADELVLTELILDNVFAEYEPAEIVALLSSFVFQEKNASEATLTPRLQKGKDTIIKFAEQIAEKQFACGVEISKEDYVNGFKFGLVEVVYEWARGMPFKHITDLTDVLEGSIVRCIVRLDETCREVRGAARMIGDPSLYKKMEEAELLIKRDIVFAASLYF
ncbi:NUC185 domain-containing protein [Umbelopsis sp. PMI_123]|nr:NUC185 domain-containing protein [Umbelopsis sp. PMI_123]